MDVPRKKKIVIIIFILLWVGIDYFAFNYPKDDFLRNLVIPDGWLHSLRSISYYGNDFNNTHGLNLNFLSTVAGYPKLGAEDGILPGFNSPWRVWTDWVSYSYKIGKDSEILEGYEIFTWFSAFRVFIPPGFEGYYDVCLGSDDSIKVWKDGALIHENYLIDSRRILPDTDIVEDVYFHTGPNIFIVGIYQKTDVTGFCFRIKNQKGQVVPVIGIYYYLSLPPEHYGWEVTLLSILVIAVFVWVYIIY